MLQMSKHETDKNYYRKKKKERREKNRGGGGGGGGEDSQENWIHPFPRSVPFKL